MQLEQVTENTEQFKGYTFQCTPEQSTELAKFVKDWAKQQDKEISLDSTEYFLAIVFTPGKDAVVHLRFAQ